MKEYIFKRIVHTFITLYIIVSLTFIFLQVLSPVDPLTMYLGRGAPMANPRIREEIIVRFGLNESIAQRYVKYIINTFTGNFGYSIKTQTPVIYELSRRIGPTLLLGGLSLIITALLGIGVGVLAATKRGSKLDLLVISSALITWGLPSFFVQLLFLIVFAVILQWFPAIGMLDTPPPPFLSFDYIIQVLYHMTLPLTTIVLLGFGFFALYTRNMMLDTLTQDFIVTARAKGLKERVVVRRYALKATLPPILSMFVLSIPTIWWLETMSEIIFAWPGIGRWFLESVLFNDYPVVQAIIFLYSILILGGNFITDIIYTWIDPRIRLGTVRHGG